MKTEIIKEIFKDQIKKDIPKFRVGDRVEVEEKIIEQDKSRTQVFEGVVIARRGSGISETFTVRKISYGVGVEKTYPIHSPLIQKISVIRRGKVRRAKLYYLRRKVGRGAKVEEREGYKEEENVSLGREINKGKEN